MSQLRHCPVNVPEIWGAQLSHTELGSTGRETVSFRIQEKTDRFVKSQIWGKTPAQFFISLSPQRHSSLAVLCARCKRAGHDHSPQLMETLKGRMKSCCSFPRE